MRTLIWALTMFAGTALAQNDKAPIPYGHYRKLQSKALGETRTLLIRLPIDYDKGAKTYPVLYKLDGGIDGALQAFAGVNYLADMTSRVPDHIVVGIENTNRGRDMGAGRANFLRFISTELIPFIDAEYRTSRFRILSGESASAVFGMHVFLTEPKLFQGYILASFAFGWPELVASFEENLKQLAKMQNTGTRYLFVTNGRHDEYDRDGSRTRAGERFLDSIRQTLPAIQVKYQVYEDEGHVPFPSLYDGLNWIYARQRTAARVSFADPGQGLNPLAARGVAVADFNGDGRLDIVVVNQTSPDGTGHRIYFGNGQGRFTASGQILDNPADWQGRPAVGDVNGDGKPDIITGRTVWLNDGTGRFAAHPGWIETNEPGELAVVALADLNGDGSPDLFAIHDWKSLRVYLNDGEGHFRDTGQRLGLESGSAVMSSVALGDVNGDGFIDAVAGGWRNANTDPCPNRVWLNNGKGNFRDSGQTFDEGEHHVHGVAVGDVNGDGRPDVVLALTTPGRAGRIYLNDGKGRFHDSGQTIGHRWAHTAVLGDFNGDGSPDIFLACGEPATGTPNEVWLNDGKGVFRDSGARLGNAFSWDAALGDLNGDGRLDAVVGNLRVVDGAKNPPVFGGRAAEIWLNTGR